MSTSLATRPKGDAVDLDDLYGMAAGDPDGPDANGPGANGPAADGAAAVKPDAGSPGDGSSSAILSSLMSSR